ncbi:MAG: hypothetical protein V4754_18670 [Pseudomonadota bacterium]
MLANEYQPDAASNTLNNNIVPNAKASREPILIFEIFIMFSVGIDAFAAHATCHAAGRYDGIFSVKLACRGDEVCVQRRRLPT